MKLETVGQILYKGFGDRVLIGVLIAHLRKSTPESCYKWIKENHPLLDGVSDDEWDRLGKIVGDTGVDITKEDVVAALRKYRLDLLSVIINTQGGMQWLDTQVEEIKKKLGLNKS